MVTYEGCQKCAAVKQRIVALLKNNNIEADIVEYDSESNDAVSLALTYDLNEVPSFTVNGVPFGSEFDSGEFVNAARK
jgi:hypothetical protein